MATRAHAFVAMPFGRKPGPNDIEVDYNRVYKELIAPAIEAAGLSAFRADQEQAAGSILPDMFQELLIADLVVADLSIANPNVWYELGVRHALRSRGVVLLFGSPAGGKSPSAFDLYTDRKLRYSLAGDGPDPATLKEDTAALTAMIKATMASWHERRISPVYYHLPNLQEPDWKTLVFGNVREIWDAHRRWEDRLQLALESGRIGDLLVLADEGPVAAFRSEAWIRAGTALRKSGQFLLALEYLGKGLAVEPRALTGLRETGICLQRLGMRGAAGHSLARARRHFETVLEEHPRDVETWALLGRVDKDAWVAAWRRDGSDEKTKRDDAADEGALLGAAIRSYDRAYRSSPGHYFSGINALVLMHLALHLGTDGGGSAHTRDIMAGAVRFAAENEADPQQRFWSLVTLGDLAVLDGTPDEVQRAYREAAAVPGVSWFELHSSHDQLLLLSELGFRPEAVAAGIAVFDRRLQRLQRPEDTWVPRNVLLFSGHMVDGPGRQTPRFPAAAEPLAAAAIAETLAKLGADGSDLALCQAAAGGDLLFLEACQQRGVRCQVLLPFDEPAFVERSVLPAVDGARWRDRFFAALGAANTTVRVMPTELGPAPDGIDPFERCNLWLLYSALAAGLQKVRFIALWNGARGDGPGGTAHMVDEVKRLTGRVTVLDTRELFRPVLPGPAG
jgi:tetratricopeptide (TPR) repeat protein